MNTLSEGVHAARPAVDAGLNHSGDDHFKGLDFPEINRGERNALRAFWPFEDFEPLSKRIRIGLPSMHSLTDKNLMEEGPAGIFGPTFRLTETGRALILMQYGVEFGKGLLRR